MSLKQKKLVTAIKKSLTNQNVTSARTIGSHTPMHDSAANTQQSQLPILVPEENGIQKIRSKLVAHIDAGDLSESVIETIRDANGFVPVEGILLDYKRDVPTDRYSECKLIKHIQAFHNTYGGYLILGAEEIEKDKLIAPVCESLVAIEAKKIRDLCREYFSSPIEIQTRVHVLKIGTHSFQVQLIHVPKRHLSEPVCTKREGPKDAKGKPVFSLDQVIVRDGDNSIPATTLHHWRLLYGKRTVPYASISIVEAENRPIWNNLPERGYICGQFIGRQDVLSSLFGWLADDFSCVKVLAGEGGLGKTSLAYQFASEVARSRMVDVESVVWLTAKRLQFRAMLNEYEELANPHFSSCVELFAELAINMGATEEEITNATDATFPKILRTLGQHVRIFAVIDDLDSLEIDEQKRSIECCQQLAGLGSRFLFTTRKNATASTSTALEIQGLTRDEYPLLANSWCDRLAIAHFSDKDLSRVWETTRGSPLYTESLLRLVKGGMSIGDANAKWRGNLGLGVC